VLFGTTVCDISAAVSSESQIACTAGTSPSGIYHISVLVPGLGYASVVAAASQFTYVMEITDVQPTQGTYEFAAQKGEQNRRKNGEHKLLNVKESLSDSVVLRIWSTFGCFSELVSITQVVYMVTSQRHSTRLMRSHGNE